MDDSTFLVLFTIGFLLAVFFALGKWYPGSGAAQLDWRPTRSPEVEAQNELDDIQQMLDAQNERRARTGRPPLTEEGIRAEVAAEEQRLAEELIRRRREERGGRTAE